MIVIGDAMRQFLAVTALFGLCSGLLVGQPVVAAPGALPVATAVPAVDRTPAVTALGPASLAVVWPDAGRKRVSLQTSTSGTWSPVTALDASGRIDKASGVGAVADASTKRLVVAAVVGGVVQVRVKTNGKWSGWTGLGSGYVGVPAVANLGKGNFAVVARTTKKTLQARFFRGGRWAGWVRFAGTFSTSPAAAGYTGNAVVIAAADTRGTVRTTTLASSAKPAAWRATSLTTTVTPGLAVNTTRAWHLLARAKDGTVSEQRSASGGRTWTRAAVIGAGLATGVGVTSRSGGLLDAVGLDSAGRLVRAAFDGRRWSPFRIVEPLVVAPSTSVLPDDAIAEITGEPTGEQKLTVQDPAAVPKPGEVIVASSTTATPDGLLARVVSVDAAADGTATVTTTPARLTDAMPSGSIDVPFTLSAADVQSAGRLQPRAATTRAAAAEPLSQTISKNITCSGSVGASVSGSVSISPEFHLTASWSVLRGVQEVTFTGGVTEDARLRAAIDAQASCKLSPTPLLTTPIRFRPIVFMAGPVPIVISPELQLYLDASGEVQAAVAVEARQTAEATAGLRWKDGAINPIAKLSNTFTYIPPSPTVNVSLETGVAPKFSFLLYGVAGPRLDTRVHVRLNADPSANPSWTLRAGITAGVQLVVPPLDISHGKSDVIRYEKVLAQAAPKPTTPPVTPPPTTNPPAGTKVINATIDGWATCFENDKWSFFLTGAGGSSGVPVPSSISAKIRGGGTLSIPVVRRATSPSDLSTYAIASSAKLTGEATAIIDQDWNASDARFTMDGGPCAPTVTTIGASRTTATTKTKITLSGRIRTSTGAGVNRHPFSIRWHSPSRDGKGQEIDLVTNADGTFSTVVTVDDIGKHHFTAEYHGSGPLEAALDGSEAAVTVAVTR